MSLSLYRLIQLIIEWKYYFIFFLVGVLLGIASVFLGQKVMRHRRTIYTQGTEIYVGNLPYATRERELKKLFSKYGKVLDARIIRKNGKSKGFGFIIMADNRSAEEAIKATNGIEYKGRKIVVNIAKST